MNVSFKSFNILISALEALAVTTTEIEVLDDQNVITGTQQDYWGKKKGRSTKAKESTGWTPHPPVARHLASVIYHHKAESFGDSILSFRLYPYAILRESIRPRSLIRGSWGSVKLLIHICKTATQKTIDLTTSASRRVDTTGLELTLNVVEKEVDKPTRKPMLTWVDVAE